jgi:hypothetical protein
VGKLEMESRIDFLLIDLSIWWCKFSLGFNDYCHKDLLSSPLDSLWYEGEVSWFDFNYPETMFTVVVIVVFLGTRGFIHELFPRFSDVLHKIIILGSVIPLIGYFIYMYFTL